MTKKILILVFISVIAIIFRFYISNSIPEISHSQIYFFGILNILFIFLTGEKLFNEKIATVTSLLYAISPWSAYLDVMGSEYIFHLCVLLVLVLTFLYIKTKVSKMIILIGMFLVIATMTKISLYSNIGLINAVNDFRGETLESNFRMIGKFVENRYIYLAEHSLFNVLKHISPVTYFTQEFKLLNFSFSPPIFVGFLIPFIFGLKLWYFFWRKYKFKAFLVLVFLIPSILSNNSPDLSKLVIFSPIIFLTISYGLIAVLIPSKDKLFKLLLCVTILLIVTQWVTTLVDISEREQIRYQKAFMNK